MTIDGYQTENNFLKLPRLHCDVNSPLHLSLFSLSTCSTSILSMEELPKDGALVLAYRLIWYKTLHSHHIKRSDFVCQSMILKDIFDVNAKKCCFKLIVICCSSSCKEFQAPHSRSQQLQFILFHEYASQTEFVHDIRALQSVKLKRPIHAISDICYN